MQKFEKGDYIYFNFLHGEKILGRIVSTNIQTCVVELYIDKKKDKTIEKEILEVEYSEISPVSPNHIPMPKENITKGESEI